MNSLSELDSSIRQLIEQYQQALAQIAELQQENELQREEIMRTHAELVQLKSDHKHLETAHAMLAETTDNEQRERARQRISNLIAQVDRAIEVLSK